MINTLHAPYVGQLVKLLANPTEGQEELVVTYHGDGVVQARPTSEGDGLFVESFADGGTWEPYTVHGATSAEQYFNTLTGATGMRAEDPRERLLLHCAYRAAVSLGLEGDVAYAFAVRAWQRVVDAPMAESVWSVVGCSTMAGVPVVSEDGSVVGVLVAAPVEGSLVARVRVATVAGEATNVEMEYCAPHLLILN